MLRLKGKQSKKVSIKDIIVRDYNLVRVHSDLAHSILQELINKAKIKGTSQTVKYKINKAIFYKIRVHSASVLF